MMTNPQTSNPLVVDKKGEFKPCTIPDKLYFGISDVAELCQVENHVIRYWEKQFPELNVVKRRGRRYFTRSDVLLIQKIRYLLYTKKLTIEGAKLEFQKMAPDASKKVLAEVLEGLEALLPTLAEE